MMQVALMISST